MLSWEYPPFSVGGLAKHVEELSEALSQRQVEIHILTVGANHTLKTEKTKNLWVHRVESYPLQAPNFITWVQHLNFRLIEEAIGLIHSLGTIDLIHAHDWLAGYTGRVLKNSYMLPLVATIHATESGRNQGLYTTDQHYINQIEWWLTYEAWKVIVCSQHMFREVKQLFNLPEDKIKILPNGVNAIKFQDTPTKNISFGPGKKIFFIGRLVREKGVQVLLEAAPQIIAREPKVQFLIAGKGPMEGELKQLARNLRIDSHVQFLGYVDEEIKMNLYKQATVSVFPSLYEPFGIVALEAMAAGVPVIVSDTGGLGEIIKNGCTGLKVSPGNVDALAKSILQIFQDKDIAERLKVNSLSVVKNQYSWGNIAEKTKNIYLEVLDEYKKSPWGKTNQIDTSLRKTERGY
jgi:glycogen(starch) synthase